MPDNNAAGKIAVIGSGLIGRAWSISFARAGHEVALYDSQKGAAPAAMEALPPLLEELAERGLLNDADPATVKARVTSAGSLGEALEGAAHVQENVPEKLDIKKQVFSELDAAAPPDCVIASSTSALLPSSFTEHLEGRARCLVAHPINPPYLVPAVEVVPAPWTDPEIIARTTALMKGIGQVPIPMQREIDGFLMNRLQSALLQEAFRLVEGGYASAADVDAGIVHGLGLRWAFIGPFETIDLNAPGGIRDYVTRYGGLYKTIGEQQREIVDWTGPLLDRLEEERAAALPREDIATRQDWRDRRLMSLVEHKKAAAKDIGE